MTETAGVKIGGKKYSYKTIAVVVGALLGAFVLLRNQGSSSGQGYSSAEGTNQRITGIEEGVTKLIDDLYKYIDGMFSGQPVPAPINTMPDYWNAGGPSQDEWGLDTVAAQNFSSVGSSSNPVKLDAIDAVKGMSNLPKVKEPAPPKIATDLPKVKEPAATSSTKTPSGSIASSVQDSSEKSSSKQTTAVKSTTTATNVKTSTGSIPSAAPTATPKAKATAVPTKAKAK